MTGERLGRLLLHLDAAYCAAAGLIVVALFAPLGDLFDAPQLLLLFAGLATIAWAAVLYRLARRATWRRLVAAVAAANAGATAGLATLAALAPGIGGRLLLAAVAAEVAAFAVGQTAALRR